MRAIRQEERTLIEAVAARLDDGARRDRLLRDVATAQVISPDSRPWLVEFALPGHERPTGGGQGEFPVEMHLLDGDGAGITAMLYEDADGRLFELELVRWGDGEVQSPDWSTLRIFA